MAPIYDTDLAEERFTQDEWSRYELWEKVEIRLRRRKRLWVASACLAFLCLSSVPIVMDRLPKWRSLAATRRLAEEVNRIKRDASLAHAAYRIRFKGGGSLEYVIERSADCSSKQPPVLIRSGELVKGTQSDQYALLAPEQGKTMGLTGFVESLCYDYLAGSDTVLKDESLVGFGVMPVNDVTEHRMDRLAILLVNGPSAEISFE